MDYLGATCGGCLRLISERILAAFDMTVVRRGHSAPTSVLADYWTLTKPEVRKAAMKRDLTERVETAIINSNAAK